MTKRKRSHNQKAAGNDLHRRPKGKGAAWVFASVVIGAIVIVAIYQFAIKGTDDHPSQLQRLTQFKHHGDLVFLSDGGDTLKAIKIEIVTDIERIAAGLMFRKELPDDEGMLFDLPQEEIQSFWMKNTLIPLDMIFANSTGRIVTIHENTIPQLKDTSYFSTEPAKWVVEVRAGFAQSYDINVGDSLVWEWVDSLAAKN